MYTPHGDFSEIVAFISGFAAGRQPGKSYLEGELHSFGVWMAQRFGMVARNWVWWDVLLYGFENDETRALRELPGFYKEFVAAEILDVEE